jgi:hypothetical protein
MSESLPKNVAAYASARQMKIARRLGLGNQGMVFAGCSSGKYFVRGNPIGRRRGHPPTLNTSMPRQSSDPAQLALSLQIYPHSKAAYSGNLAEKQAHTQNE